MSLESVVPQVVFGVSGAPGVYCVLVHLVSTVSLVFLVSTVSLVVLVSTMSLVP